MSANPGDGAFSAVVRAHGGVAVTGEVDIATAPALQNAIEAAAEQHAGDVVVDVSGVEFIDSSGMNVFVRCYKPLDSAGRALILRGASASVRRALEVGGITTFLRVD